MDEAGEPAFYDHYVIYVGLHRADFRARWGFHLQSDAADYRGESPCERIYLPLHDGLLDMHVHVYVFHLREP